MLTAFSRPPARMLLTLWALCALPPTMARAQDGRHGQGHDALHHWYKHLTQPGSTAKCCDDRDCRPTRAYVGDDGAWRALLDGRWVVVPRNRVLPVTAPDGASHICANDSGVIYCFIGGVPRS